MLKKDSNYMTSTGRDADASQCCTSGLEDHKGLELEQLGHDFEVCIVVDTGDFFGAVSCSIGAELMQFIC